MIFLKPLIYSDTVFRVLFLLLSLVGTGLCGGGYELKTDDTYSYRKQTTLISALNFLFQ